MFEKERLSVEIGEKKIKILVGTRDKIDFYGIIETPENSVQEDKLVKIEAIAEVINRFIAENKIKIKKISFVIESRDIVTRNMETPVMEEEGLRKAVEWETAQYLPSAEEDYYIDFQIIDKISDKEKKTYKMLVAAVLKTKVDNYVELAKALNMELVSIDISSNSIARVFKGVYSKENKNESTGIIEIDHNSSSIIILDKGKLFIERAVPFGINSILKQVSADSLDGFNILEADENRRKIQTLLDNVFASFDRIIQFYASGKTEKRLDSIYVIGEGAYIKGIDEYIQRYFTSPTKVITNPSEINIKLKHDKDLDFRLYVKALGVLLRKE